MSLALFVMMGAMFIYYAAAVLFNTKGEPREAIVALSMLQSGDWILPVSFGTDIPYKPPFMAWCIAAISWLTGGEVTEFTSRLPSLISAMIMIIATCRFFTHRANDALVGFLTAFITITSMEVFRAATACRVDMMLTMFIVTSIYSLFGWYENGSQRLPWPAILLMSGGALTKGPVGIILPCLCIWLHGMIYGSRKWTLTWKLFVSAVLACLIPAIWYWLAVVQGGEEFVNLMLEENFGRFTGSMSYGSHENPFYYNFITIIAGMAPYTLLAILALCFLGAHGKRQTVRNSHSARNLIRFSALVALTILIFYCIPKSKRSVYLLPMYPFMAYMVTRLILWLFDSGRNIALRVFNIVLSIVAMVAAIAYFILVSGVADNLKFIQILGFNQSIPQIVIFSILAIATLLVAIMSIKASPRFENQVRAMVAVIGCTYIFVNSAIIPPILSAKTDKYIATYINEQLPPTQRYTITLACLCYGSIPPDFTQPTACV